MSFQVSSNFLNGEEQTKAQIATLGQELKNLRSELQEHQVNRVEENCRPLLPNQKRRQNATQFCNHCRTTGHSSSWCRMKKRNEKLKRIQNERTAGKKVTFTQDYYRKRGPGHGSKQWIRGQDFRRMNQNYTKNRPMRNPSPVYQNFSRQLNSAYMTNNPINGRSYEQHSTQKLIRSDRIRKGSFNNQNWRNTGISFLSPSTSRRFFSKNNSYRQPRSN